ncbi:MAG: circularly permuted type 2 ATP-grasp protein [Planctomycetaceae bacterium]
MDLPTLSQIDFTTASGPGWAGGVFNETFETSGKPHLHWQPLLDELSLLTAEELTNRSEQAQQTLHENGVSYNVFAERGDHHPWSLDLIPLTLSREQWDWMSRALAQRARLLDLITRDIYGPQNLLRSGDIPAEVVFPQLRYQRAFANLIAPNQVGLTLYATELARGADGFWYAMADRTDAPVGLGFALESRVITSRLMPQIMHRLRMERLAPFFLRVKNSLVRLSGKDTPRIVVLSPGPQSRFYFEDLYLARYLGYTLVEGSDLAVRDDEVFLKTLSGLHPVDVIYSRTMESALDPLEQGASASTGIPGLLQAIRSGNVRLANAPGCGLLEAPVFMAFLPQLCSKLLHQPLMLPSIRTWWYGDPESQRTVNERFSELVIKPAFQSSGQDEYLVSELSSQELQDLRARMTKNPAHFVAQERIQRSAAPCWRDQQVQPGHIALRTYGVAEENGNYQIMPGGLVRVAESSQPMELSVLAGISSKDLWIPAEGEVAPISLLIRPDTPVTLKRSEPLFPSRVADNLYWLGQSFERACFLARLLRAALARLTDESDDDLPELTGLLRALVDQGQLDPGYVIDDLETKLPDLQDYMVKVLFDPGEPLGLANSMSELRRLNASVRDWISPELWQTSQYASEDYFAAAMRTDDFSELLTLVDRLLFDLAAVSGQVHDGMIRGPAWRFLDIGRRIERATNTAKLLLSTIDAGLISQRPMLRAVLEVLDCRMTYRMRYLENLQQNGVLDLAITDETNPHSISFQAVLLIEHLESLPQDIHPLRSPESRSLMRLVHSARMLTTFELEESPPKKVVAELQGMQKSLKELADELTKKYLVHSVRPRQMGD